MLLSEMEAEADVLALIAPHFADRLPMENWVILDRSRQKAALHPAGKGFLILEEITEEAMREFTDSGTEDRYQELWNCFHDAISIDARINPGLQMQMLPHKFRPFMTEFQAKR